MSLLDCLFPRHPRRPTTVRLIQFTTGRPVERVLSFEHAKVEVQKVMEEEAESFDDPDNPFRYLSLQNIDEDDA
jgi:hypothetical protein